MRQQVGEKALGSLALETALQSELDQIAIVTKQSDTLDWIPSELFQSYQQKWFQIPCPDSSKGQAHSLKCGLRYAKKHRAEAAVVMLADQPLISTDIIHQLIAEHKQEKTKHDPILFVAATHEGIPRPPILFPDSMFAELSNLQGDQGARNIIRNRMNEGRLIEFKNPKLFFDVDTQVDHMTLLKWMNAKGAC